MPDQSALDSISMSIEHLEKAREMYLDNNTEDTFMYLSEAGEELLNAKTFVKRS